MLKEARITLVKTGKFNSIIKLEAGSYFPPELECWEASTGNDSWYPSDLSDPDTDSDHSGWRCDYVDKDGIATKSLWFKVPNRLVTHYIYTSNEWGEVAP